MAAAKKQTSSASGAAAFRGGLAWLFGSGRTLLVIALLVGAVAGGALFAWWKLKGRIVPAYAVGPEQVEITPQPDWIRVSDVRAEVFRYPALDGPLSLLDDDLAARISNAFARHPWVASLKPPVVQKTAGKVKVDLVYRKPVCMVLVPNGPRYGRQPVDADGVLLPSTDFTSQQADRYPLLASVDRGPTVSPGTRWGDTRVVGGAEIAARLADVWQTMHLARIEPWADYPSAPLPPGVDAMAMPTNLGQHIEPVFTLVTQGRSRIVWGHAPGAKIAGEPSADEKVAWLKRYFERHDTLDSPQELDLRKVTPPRQ
jgi:hypothetical protein